MLIYKLATGYKIKYGKILSDEVEIKEEGILTEKQKANVAWQQALLRMPQFLINAVGQPIKNPNEVKKVQQILLDKGQKMEAGADGIFGRQTYSALWGFQYKNKLPATGTLNQETVRALGLQ